MKAQLINEMKVRLPAISENESVARSLVSAFSASLNPTVEELADLRCAVSEAVTNCIVHAYVHKKESDARFFHLTVRLYDEGTVCVEIADRGCGIEDVEKARQPFFTTGKPEERCGMGFLVMESFTDSCRVRSKVGAGTTVILKKKFSRD